MSMTPDGLPHSLHRRPRTLWSDLAGLWARFRRMPGRRRFILVAALVVLLVGVISVRRRSEPSTAVSTRETTTVPVEVPETTTIGPLLPAGDDKAVKSNPDGDSLVLGDDTKIRLIGIDAPDVERKACFSEQATVHLRELLPPDTPVRVVYDANRTDRFRRTLAYIYRVNDGLLVNVAMATDGFAIAQPMPPNGAHAPEITDAVAGARAAKRGLWESCPSTTTTVRRVTTTTKSATTTTKPATATSSTVAGATTSSTKAPAPGLTPAVVGDSCAPTGSLGQSREGVRTVCTNNLLGPKWQPA